MNASPIGRLLGGLQFFTAARLTAAPRGVEILWDKFGVGHVYAANLESRDQF